MLIISNTGLANICKRCGAVSKERYYPAFSPSLQILIKNTATRIKVNLSNTDILIINKIIKKEDPDGDTLLYTYHCWGLCQGKFGTFKDLNIPWKTKCPSDQVELIIKYIRKRYKTFSNAWKHHRQYNWY